MFYKLNSEPSESEKSLLEQIRQINKNKKEIDSLKKQIHYSEFSKQINDYKYEELQKKKSNKKSQNYHLKKENHFYIFQKTNS